MTGARIAAWMKQNGWALNLAFIFVGAYFVAGTANSILARGLWSVPSADTQSARGVTARPQARAKVTYTAMAARNLFAAQREVLHPVADTTEPDDSTLLAGAEYDPNNLKKCTLSNSLRATLVADGAPEWSIAVLYSSQAREPEVFSINEGSNAIAADATLIEIREREIVVRRREHFELCHAEGEGTAPVAVATRGRAPEEKRAPSRGPADPEGNIQKTSDTEWSISREYLDKDVLQNLSAIATQARIVPSFKNGKPNGFKLFSIKPNSLFAKIGLQNGDVINKINGYEMNSPDKALEIYQKLREASNISVDLTRRGQTRSHAYGIQ